LEVKEMEYIYSALLLHSAGKEITEDNVKKVLDAAGVKADDARIKALTASLDGVNIEEAISTAVAVPAAGAPAGAGAAAEPAGKDEDKKEKKEEKKKEKKEEKKVSEEEAAAGLGALFG
jgi:large subunit ribosomal protein L12